MRVNIVRHILPKFVYLHICLYCLVEVNLSGNTFNLSLKFDYTVPEIPPAFETPEYSSELTGRLTCTLIRTFGITSCYSL